MLRDYQVDICKRVREAFDTHRSVMVQMPTGTGKTMVLAELVKRLKINDEGLKILIVAHRRELIEQIQKTLKKVFFFENSPVPSLASPKSLALGNDQMHLSLLSLNQDFAPEEGLHLSPKSSPLRGEDLKPGRQGLYEQASFNCVDSRLHSAEHSSELDALLSLAREFAPQGVARELPTQQSCDCLCAEGAAAHSGAECLIQVRSIQWLTQNIDKVNKKPDLVIVDEAHHALAKTYKMMWDTWPDAKFLGLTATPCRLNGKGFTDLFDVLLSSLTVPEFIEKGVLAPFDYVTINEGSSQQQLIDSLTKRGADGDYQVKEMNEVLNKRPSIEQLYNCYTKFAKKKKGIIYAVSIEHARSIAEYYESKGIKAVAISAKTPAKERAGFLDDFRKGKIQTLVNVDIFSEGFDCPDVEFIQLARPTLSLAKYLQMVGRGLRPHKKKECCVILDNVGLVRLFGLPTRCWNWQSAFEGRIKIKDERLKIRDSHSSLINNQEIKSSHSSLINNQEIKSSHSSLINNQEIKSSHSSLINNQEINSFSLVVAHEQLEQLIKDAKLEEWNSRQGIVEEEAKAFQSENGKLWGLRRGSMIMVEPTYLRVFNIKDGQAAVRLQDTKLAVVDMSGNIIRGLGKGSSAHLCSKDFVEVERNNDYDYIDLLSGKPYYHLPTLVTRGEIQLIKVADDGWLLRMMDPFDYGSVNFDYCSRTIDEYEYFYMLYLSNDRGIMDGYAVNTKILIVFKGDNERAYWLYDVHEDGSIDVIDRQGNAYHVKPDGTREKLNRCDILEQSMSILKEIAIQYRKKGGAPDDQYNLLRFRNRVLADRLNEKLKALKIMNHL